MAARAVTRAVLVALALVVAVGGCALGPRAIERTHARYGTALQRVEEEEFLKNIVRLRYTEAPRNLDVAAIAAQYELTAGAEARPFFEAPNPAGGVFRTFTTLLPFASVGGADRPTVSLDPRDDGTTVRQFLTPISAETLVFLAQTGWPVSSVVRIWVDRLNGVPNWGQAGGAPRQVPPDFERFLRAAELLQQAQDREIVSVRAEDRVTDLSDPLPAAAVDGAAVAQAAKDGFEYRRRGDGWVLAKREQQLVLRVSPIGRGSPEMVELAALLNLKPGESRYEMGIASGVTDPAKAPVEPSTVLQVTPRSTAQALFFLANGVEVPPEHFATGVAPCPRTGRIRPGRRATCSGSTRAMVTGTNRPSAPTWRCGTGTTGTTSTTATGRAKRRSC